MPRQTLLLKKTFEHYQPFPGQFNIFSVDKKLLKQKILFFQEKFDKKYFRLIYDFFRLPDFYLFLSNDGDFAEKLRTLEFPAKLFEETQQQK